jgi:Ca2+-binding EF-hand superfamily protein
VSRRSTAGSIQHCTPSCPTLPNWVQTRWWKLRVWILSPPGSGIHQEIRVSSPTAQTPLRRELTGLESTLFGQMPPKASPLGQRKFTEPQRKRLREVFDLLDTDGSDELDYTELKDALQKFGVKLSLKELKNIWVSADKDANSGINFEDFCDSIEKLPTTLLDRRESMIKLQEVLTGANEDEDGKKGKGKQTPSSCSLM